MRGLAAVIACAVPTVATVAAADPKPLGDCKAELDARHVAWKPASRAGIAVPVEIVGAIGGVTLAAAEPGQALVVDCSLAVSLDEAGRYLRELGIERATVSSEPARRGLLAGAAANTRGDGLAIDVSVLSGRQLGTLRIERDYEAGLGDETDCVGAPVTAAGAVLKTLQCQLVRSGLFHLVLSPDYDDAHRDHFHLEALPWSERREVHSSLSAAH